MNKSKEDILADVYKTPVRVIKLLSEKSSNTKNTLHAMSEYAQQESIAFLDSIRDYIRESHCNIATDERTSEEFYQIYKSQQ